METEQFAALMKMAYGAFAARLVIIVALLMAFGLFSWAMWMGTVLSLCVAAAFALVVFLPVLLRKEASSGGSTT